MKNWKFTYGFAEILLGIVLFSGALCGCAKKGTEKKSNAKALNEKELDEKALNAKELNAKDDFPLKIISLSPAATEVLFAIGADAQIAAVSDFSDYPEEAKNKPVIGGFDGKTISIEVLLSFKPDFVYLTGGMHDFLIPTLEKYGIKYFVSSGESVEGVKNEILEVGKITGHFAEAKNVVAEIDEKISQAGNGKFSGKSVYYEVWNAPYMSCGTESFINDVLVLAGVKNIFSDIAEAYPIISEETLIARNPDVILLPQSSGVSIEQVKMRKGWENISAVKNGCVYLVDDNLITRPGPRIGDSVLAISKLCNF
ncbi:MAG: cobalamin-binding protein [Treponema sp.]|nr:cobalamin-binding protein [Treponema sp.]